MCGLCHPLSNTHGARTPFQKLSQIIFRESCLLKVRSFRESSFHARALIPKCAVRSCRSCKFRQSARKIFDPGNGWSLDTTTTVLFVRAALSNMVLFSFIRAGIPASALVSHYSFGSTGGIVSPSSRTQPKGEICDDELVRNSPIRGVVFNNSYDSVLYYTITSHSHPYLSITCPDMSNCPSRFVNPLQPEVVKFINDHKTELNPWFYQMAKKKGVLK